MSRLLCPGCGERVTVPEDQSRAKMRCPGCGYYVEVPAEMRSRGEVVETAPVAATTAKVKKEKAPPPPLLVGDDDEDSDAPYTVPGDEHKKCSACYREIPYDATFCTLCGTDFASGKKAKLEYEPFNRTWEPRWNLDQRFKVLGALLAVDLALAIFVSTETSFMGGLQSFIIQGWLQAFLIGTYERISVKRTTKRSGTLTKQWRFAFIGAKPFKLDWKKSQGVGIVATQNAGLLEWFTFIYLILLFIVPGVLFYWFVMRPDRFNVVLCDVHGCTNEIAFRTTDRDQADEICRSISDATGLWYKPVL